MAEITQRLGFDASSAISTLRELSTALGNVNTQLTTLNQVSGKQRGIADVGKSLGKTKEQALEADRRIRKLREGFRETGKAGAQAGRNITLSWETMLRVVQTQLIVRALGALQQGFVETAEAAREFEIQVARIAQIIQEPGTSIEGLKDSLRDLSDELGRPIAEVGTAAYEAFQNDLGNTQETIELLRGAAGDLAVITGGELVDAVNAISSVMKVFNLDAEEANDVVDVLFGTIDKGRVTLDELANSLGSVAPLGREVSVTYREIGAAIAAITLQGVDAARAQTQLRGVFNALLKPTKDLQGAFAQLGVQSGRELIETTGGLIQALQALEQVAGGNEVTFRAFFGRIRGQLGAINILNDNASQATRILKELGEETGRAAEAAKAINEVDARQAEIAFNKIKNIFIELGDAASNVQKVLAQLFLAVIPDAETLGTLISGLAAGLGVAAIAAFAFGVSFATALAPLALVGAAVLVFARLGTQIGELINLGLGYNEQLEKTKKNLEEIEKTSKEKTRKELEKLREEVKTLKESVKDFTDDATERWKGFGESVKAVNAAITASTANALKNFSSQIKGIIQSIDQQLNGLDDAFDDAANRASTAAQRLEDFKFESSIRGQDALTEATRRTTRASKAYRDSLALARKVNIADPKQLEILRESFKESERLAKDADAAAQRVGKGGERIQEKSRRLVERNLKAQAQLERANAQRIFDFRKGLNRSEFELQKQNLANLEELAKKVGQAQTAEGIAKQFGTPEQKQETKQAADEARKEFAEAMGKVDFSKLGELGLDVAAKRVIASIAKELDTAALEWNNAASALQQALDAHGPFSAAVQISEVLGAPTGQAALDEALTRARAQAGGDPGESIQKQAEVLGEFRAEQIQAGNASQAFRDKVNESLQGLDQGIEQNLTNPLRVAFDFLKRGFTATPFDEVNKGVSAGRESVQQLSDGLREVGERLLQDGQIPARELELRLQELANQGDQLRQDGVLTSEQDEQLGQALIALLERVKEAKAENARRKLIDPAVSEDASQRLQDLQEKASELDIEIDLSDLLESTSQASTNAQTTSTNLQNSATSAGTLATNMTTTAEQSGASATSSGEMQGNAQNAIGPTSGLAEAWRQVAVNAQAAAQAAAAAGGAGGAQTAFFGRKITYRQTGGPITRGQDTQLVAAQPGERIINARQSRNFSAELVAMNAGQRPQSRDQGGPVTTIGDVNVNVHADSSGGIDGRQIGQDIRRELRRGTLRLS